MKCFLELNEDDAGDRMNYWRTLSGLVKEDVFGQDLSQKLRI
jgi:hypothetical protein